MERIKDYIVSKNIYDATEFLKNGFPAVILTETLYGILANALDKNAVEFVYKLKGRSPNKPFIVLIPNVESLEKFGITPSDLEKKLLNYKGLSVILKVSSKELEYLHRGTNSLAFRIPSKENLLQLLKKLDTPLIAPSCNPQGLKPASNIREAINYFGNKIPIYIDEGETQNKTPSTIVRVKNNNEIEVVRRGNIEIEKLTLSW